MRGACGVQPHHGTSTGGLARARPWQGTDHPETVRYTRHSGGSTSRHQWKQKVEGDRAGVLSMLRRVRGP